MSFAGYIANCLSWGDSGKGRVTNDLTIACGSTLNVRFSGGPQAAHNVITDDGRHHCFAQFGAGSFNPSVRTHLSRHMLIEPYAMLNESTVLGKAGVTDAIQRLTVDPEAVIITPWHWLANRVRELCRGTEAHGSGGMGIGECRSMQIKGTALHVGNLKSKDLTRAILENIRQTAISSLPAEHKIPDCAQALYAELSEEKVEPNVEFYRDWAASVKQVKVPMIDGPVVFEGSQGVMLDEKYGSFPNNSWTNCTFENAVKLCGEWGLNPVRVGILRTYSTRHGAGPFVTHDPAYDYPDHNRQRDSWQGEFRQGPLDLVAARYAVRVSRPDCLAITHMDRVSDNWEYCTNYNLNGTHHTPDFTKSDSVHPCEPIITKIDGKNALQIIGTQLGVPIRYTTSGPTHKDFTELMAKAAA